MPELNPLPTAYIESTVPSYLVGRLSRDHLIAGHQHLTVEWWSTAPNHYDLVVSDAVLQEISCGDAEMASRRLQSVRDLTSLARVPEVTELNEIYLQ